MKAIWLSLLLLSCSAPNDDERSGEGGAQAGGAQAGGASSHGGSETGTGGGGASHGGSAASGGASANGGLGGAAQAGSAGAGANCEASWAEYQTLEMSARKCDPAAPTPQCKFSIVVLDHCGCSVPANESSRDYLKARQRLTKYLQNCHFPDMCKSCPASVMAGCEADGSGDPVCVYQ